MSRGSCWRGTVQTGRTRRLVPPWNGRLLLCGLGCRGGFALEGGVVVMVRPLQACCSRQGRTFFICRADKAAQVGQQASGNIATATRTQ